MKLVTTTLALSFLSACCVHAGISRPQISIQVRDGDFGDLKGLDPTVSWQGSSTYEGFDLEYGTEASLHLTDDVSSLPKNVWGKVSRKCGDWMASVRGRIEAKDLKTVALGVTAESPAGADFVLDVTGSAGDKGVSVSNIKATKGFNLNSSYISVTPQLNVLSPRSSDVLIKFKEGKMDVGLKASLSSQKVRLSRQIDDYNRVAPTISSGGAFSLEWERVFGGKYEGSSVVTTLTPGEAIDVVLKEGEWRASINMPLEGTSIKGANINIKRELKL